MQDVVRAPWHGKITSASTVGRSSSNQPALRSYIDCFTTAGWILPVCHFRASKEAAVLAEIMLHSGGAKTTQVAGPYQMLHFRARIGQAFKKSPFLHFIPFSTCHWVSRSKCPALPLLHASSHLYASKGCQHIENKVRDKSTSLISIIECI